jgi:hypothetical protein
MLKLDIGCGAAKRSQFVGVDVIGDPDIICDVSRERLPIDDQSVCHIYSAHCIEHIPQDRLFHVFQEMTRVSAQGGLIEIWHPHVSHSDAFVFGHINYLSEALYDHLGCTHRAFWQSNFHGVQWILEEIRYGIDGFVLDDMRDMGIDMDFAVSYFREVIREIGAFIRVDRSAADGPVHYRRSICGNGNRVDRIRRLADGPRASTLLRGANVAVRPLE